MILYDGFWVGFLTGVGVMILVVCICKLIYIISGESEKTKAASGTAIPTSGRGKSTQSL